CTHKDAGWVEFLSATRNFTCAPLAIRALMSECTTNSPRCSLYRQRYLAQGEFALQRAERLGVGDAPPPASDRCRPGTQHPLAQPVDHQVDGLVEALREHA